MDFEQLEALQKQIQETPIFFYKSILSCPYWEKQQEILESCFKCQRTTVASCNASGKSYNVARIALAFLYAYPNSIVVTTAPTFRQVDNVIWRELRGAHEQSKVPLGGKLNQTELELGNNWYAFGVASDKPDNVRGIHATGGHILIIVEEAQGIAKDILTALEGNLTSNDVSLIYIGNPTVGYGTFFDSHKSNLFNKIVITAFDTPNFTANNIKSVADLKKFQSLDEMRYLKLPVPQLVTPQWAWGRLQEWGEDSPMFRSLVCAEFPEESTDTLIPLQWIKEALDKKFDEKELKYTVNVVSIDVARFGDDTTVFTAVDGYRQGCITRDIQWHNGKDTMKTVGKAISMFNECGYEQNRDMFVVDDTGVGGAVTDRLVELGYNVLPVNFGERAEQDGFANKKAEIFWTLRKVFQNKTIRLLDKGKVVNELNIVRFDMTSQGDIAIVPKKKMKAEGLGSPDFADSMALAIYGVMRNGDGDSGSNEPIDIEQSEVAAKTVVGNLYRKKF